MSWETIDYFNDASLNDDPYDYFDELREAAPVLPMPHLGVVAVTGYDEICEVYRDAETFSSCNSVIGPYAMFPVPLEALSARLTVEQVAPGEFTVGVFAVRAIRLRHQGLTLGYRLTPRNGGASLAYVTDNELGTGGDYELPPTWRRDFVQFLAGTDVVIHDAISGRPVCPRLARVITASVVNPITPTVSTCNADAGDTSSMAAAATQTNPNGMNA